MNDPIVKLKIISHSDLSSLFRRKEKGQGQGRKEKFTGGRKPNFGVR